MKLNDLLTGGLQFNAQNALQLYRYQLINSMLLLGAAVSLLASVMRFVLGNYAVGSIDLFLFVSFAAGWWLLRKNNRLFELISSIQLTLSFVIFVILMLFMGDNQTKLLWFSLLITVTYMIKGIRGGFTVYVAVITTLTTLYVLSHIFPQIKQYADIHLSLSEVVMAMLFYSAITLYNHFATIHQYKSMKKIKRQKKQLYKQIRTSALTELPNMLAMKEEIRQVDKSKSAIITLLIDDYAILAEEFGFDYAQKIVIKSAQILESFTQTDIQLFHVGPYQFSFLLSNHTQNDALAFAAQVKNYFEKHYLHIDHIELSISFSIGIAYGGEDMVTHADSALYEASKDGINTCKLFEEDPNRTLEQKNNIYWNHKIKEIINDRKLKVYYQPIINNKNGKIEKYEALIRAVDNGKVIPPFQFLQAAKTRGMLPSITRFVIEESFRKFQNNTLEFSINITEEDLKQNYLVSFLQEQCSRYKIAPERVFLEVLENITSTQTKTLQSQFEQFRELGFGIAIDDFGAEASNLSRLLTYNADIIKIDGMFIKNLDTDKNSIKIVETIVSLAEKLGAKTVAEFVHSETIYHIVKTLHIDYSQGYYLGAPDENLLKQKETVTT